MPKMVFCIFDDVWALSQESVLLDKHKCFSCPGPFGVLVARHELNYTKVGGKAHSRACHSWLPRICGCLPAQTSSGWHKVQSCYEHFCGFTKGLKHSLWMIYGSLWVSHTLYLPSQKNSETALIWIHKKVCAVWLTHFQYDWILHPLCMSSMGSSLPPTLPLRSVTGSVLSLRSLEHFLNKWNLNDANKVCVGLH